MFFTDQIFPVTKNLSQVFVSVKATKTSKHLVKQLVGILKSAEKAKSWVHLIKKLSHMFEL